MFFEDSFMKKKLFSVIFGQRAKIFRLWKQYSRCHEKLSIEFFLEKKMWFFFIFVYWTIFSVFLSKDFPQNCQNWILRVHRKPWKKNIFFWKNFSCSYRFRKWAKKFRPPQKLFGQGCANCFRPVDGFNLRSFFEKKIRYILSFSHTEQTLFGIQSKVFQQGCQKKLSQVSIIAGHWAISFHSFVEKIAAVMPKLHSTCLQEQFEWNFSWKKVFSFFYIIRTLSEKILAFYKFFSKELSKVFSTHPWEHFDGKFFL